MAQYKNMYNVELWKGPAASSLSMFLGDKKANRIGAYVFEDGQEVSLGGSCTGKAIRADGSTVALSGTVAGNQAYIDLPAACYAIPGPIKIYVVWGNSSTITTLVVGVGCVQVTETGTIIDPGTVVPDLSELLTQLDAMEQATAAAEAAATKSVRYDTAQSLTGAQKAQARENIGAIQVSPYDSQGSGTGVLIEY